MTIGTGIGGGGVLDGQRLHGLVHPEMGHIPVRHDRAQDPYPGCCPYHGDCLEGLASGTAMRERWGLPAEALAADHPAWALEAGYLAAALATFVCTLSPQRIILGGGVMANAALFPAVRAALGAWLNNYIRAPQLLADIDNFIVAPGLGHRAGSLGAIALAEQVAIS
jgi:fructokinase